MKMEKINKKKVYRVSLVIYDDTELKSIIDSAKKDNRTRDIVYIKHDKDLDEFGEIKKSHYHVLFNFNRGPITLRSIKVNILGVDESRYVEVLKSSWQKNLQYLIHKNSKGKFKYNIEEVVIEKGNKDEILNYIINDEPINKSRFLKEIREEIMKRDITNEYQAECWTIENFGSSGPYMENFIKISNYLKAVNASDTYLNKEKDLLGIAYIQGGSGVGKSSFAKYLSEKCVEKTNCVGIYEAAVGSKDLLDGYNGESVVIFNDLRFYNIIDVGVSTILNLTDWFNGIRINSRYKNKDISNIKFMIFTSTDPLEKLINQFEGEEKKQFYRRINTKIIMNEESISIYNFNEKTNNFGFVKNINNSFNKVSMEKKYGVKENLILDLI